MTGRFTCPQVPSASTCPVQCLTYERPHQVVEGCRQQPGELQGLLGCIQTLLPGHEFILASSKWKVKSLIYLQNPYFAKVMLQFFTKQKQTLNQSQALYLYGNFLALLL